MKNKYLLYLGTAAIVTPISILIWVGWVVDPNTYRNIVEQPLSAILFFGGVGVALLLAGVSMYLTMRSREHCVSCGAEMEKQIVQAEKLATVGTLAGGVAHEVNTPASIISGRIEAMLLDRKRYNDQDIEDLSVIKSQAERIAQITRSLLLFAKRAPAEKTRTDLNRIAREALDLIATQLAKGKVTVRTHWHPQPVLVLAQRNQLVQVVLNLVANARDAMQDGGTLTLTTGLTEGARTKAYLEVADNGPGISEDNLRKIFDPFFTTKAQGTGLGLSVSYGIVQEHGGTIQARSGTQGVSGAVFTVTLPLAG